MSTGKLSTKIQINIYMVFIELGISVYFHLIIDKNDVETLCAIEEILIRIPRLGRETRFNNIPYVKTSFNHY
jgi:hypothetical protein